VHAPSQALIDANPIPSKDACWDSDHDTVGWHVLDYDCIGSHRDIVAQRDTPLVPGPCADSHVVADDRVSDIVTTIPDGHLLISARNHFRTIDCGSIELHRTFQGSQSDHMV
jgi:hypothetical protein